MFDFLCYKSPEAYLPKQGTISYLRVLQAFHGCRKVDVYSNGHIISKDLTYKKYTPYLNVPAVRHSVIICQSGNKNKVLAEASVTLDKDSIYTAAITEDESGPKIIVFPDPRMDADHEKARLRFAHLCSGIGTIDVIIKGGEGLVENTAHNSISAYTSFDPGKYTFQLKTGTTLTTVPDISLKPGWNYTMYAVGCAEGKPNIQVFTLLDGNTYINF